MNLFKKYIDLQFKNNETLQILLDSDDKFDLWFKIIKQTIDTQLDNKNMNLLYSS